MPWRSRDEGSDNLADVSTRLPSLRPLHFVRCDFGKFGLAFVETDPAAADEATIISNMLSGQYEAPWP